LKTPRFFGGLAGRIVGMFLGLLLAAAAPLGGAAGTGCFLFCSISWKVESKFKYSLSFGCAIALSIPTKRMIAPMQTRSIPRQ
jgi:hypothetical protein